MSGHGNLSEVWRRSAGLLGGTFLLLTLTGATRGTVETHFLHANALAMDRMMAGMSVKPAGDVDQDFVAMMEPHHQGAKGLKTIEPAKQGNSCVFSILGKLSRECIWLKMFAGIANRLRAE